MKQYSALICIFLLHFCGVVLSACDETEGLPRSGFDNGADGSTEVSPDEGRNENNISEEEREAALEKTLAEDCSCDASKTELIERILETRKCEYDCDLENACLDGLDFSNVAFSSYLNAKGACARSTNFQGASFFPGVDFFESKMAGADFSDSHFHFENDFTSSIEFSQVDLRFARFINVDFDEKAYFVSATLDNAEFKNARFNYPTTTSFAANFRHASMKHTRFEEVHAASNLWAMHSDFTNGMMRGFSAKRELSFSHAVLRQATFEDIDLDGRLIFIAITNAQDAHFQDLEIREDYCGLFCAQSSNFTDANFAGSTWKEVSFIGGTKFEGASFRHTTFEEFSITQRAPDFRGVDFWDANPESIESELPPDFRGANCAPGDYCTQNP